MHEPGFPNCKNHIKHSSDLLRHYKAASTCWASNTLKTDYIAPATKALHILTYESSDTRNTSRHCSGIDSRKHRLEKYHGRHDVRETFAWTPI